MPNWGKTAQNKRAQAENQADSTFPAEEYQTILNKTKKEIKTNKWQVELSRREAPPWNSQW